MSNNARSVEARTSNQNQKSSNVIAGIDHAMNEPAVCIRDLQRDSTFWFFVTSQKKLQDRFLNDSIEGIAFDKDDYNSDIERFDHLTEILIGRLKDFSVDTVALEGYSMGSKSSRLFQIGENTGILKKKLYDSFGGVTVVAPTEVKKFATGKGNAKKEQMFSAFLGTENIDLLEEFNMKTVKKPVEDVVDSYFIVKWLEEKI